jgi:ubiquinone/menaquinone biosynthesis C-methylase UbiE
MDALAQYKEAQKQGWSHFAPLEMATTAPAAQLVKHARIQPGQRVLDVGCGTGVVAVTAARKGAQVTALDLTPALLERARENAKIARVSIDFHEGDIEALPFPDSSFDVVVSQFGHMFAPRPAVAIGQMLRVLKRGGTVAFSTWPPELFTGRSFALAASYMPPLPPDVSPPPLWGDPTFVRQQLGHAVSDIFFDRATMTVPALSPQHYQQMLERTAGPIIRLVEMLSATDVSKLEEFRRKYESLVSDYIDENLAWQDYLMTRATKV